METAGQSRSDGPALLLPGLVSRIVQRTGTDPPRMTQTGADCPRRDGLVSQAGDTLPSNGD